MYITSGSCLRRFIVELNTSLKNFTLERGNKDAPKYSKTGTSCGKNTAI